MLYLDDLDAMTRESELWLLWNPSPDPATGDYLRAIVESFSAFGSVLSFSGDFARADDGRLDAHVAELAAMVAGANVLRDDWIMRRHEGSRP